MARDMETETSVAAGESVIYPGWIIRLDIADDPILVWTGLGPLLPTGTADPQLNDLTFEGIANVGEISTIVDSKEGSPAVKLTLPGCDLSDEALRQVVFDTRQWQFRQAWMWIALFNENGEIQGEPVRVKTGRMDNMEVELGGETGVVSVNVESHQSYAGDILATRYSEQAEIDATDISQTFVHKLANLTATIGDKSQSTTGYGGTSGGGYGGGGLGGGGRGLNCVSPDTQILMADGSYVAAGLIVPGMVLRTQHEETLEWGDHIVEGVSLIAFDHRSSLELHDGRILVATPNHRVFVSGRGWTEIGKIQPGDILVGEKEGVAASVSVADMGSVVRITVEGAATYQSNGILSHNVKMMEV